MIHHGDCLEVMAGMPDASVDAIVTDPPYGLGFMGKAWDHGAPGVPFWREMLRVAKPSAYLLAFGGTRTVHRMTVALEDAGWIIRDMLVWAYASGFPKSKASLKPAWEPIVMARKPGPLRMLAIDECRIPFTGAADVEFTASRIGSYHNRPGPAAINVRRDTAEVMGSPTPGSWPERKTPRGAARDAASEEARGQSAEGKLGGVSPGRWPANVILTDPIFDGDVEGVVGGGSAGGNAPASGPTWSGPSGSASRNHFDGMGDREPQFYGDSGTYSRFFLVPKADRTDREPLVAAAVSHGSPWSWGRSASTASPDQVEPRRDSENRTARRNTHPTVKPTELMRHLVRLVTPTGGTVLDPFLGSGTTAIAAELEGFKWIGIEKEAEYVAIAEARLNGTQRGLGLSA